MRDNISDGSQSRQSDNGFHLTAMRVRRNVLTALVLAALLGSATLAVATWGGVSALPN